VQAKRRLRPHGRGEPDEFAFEVLATVDLRQVRAVCAQAAPNAIDVQRSIALSPVARKQHRPNLSRAPV